MDLADQLDLILRFVRSESPESLKRSGLGDVWHSRDFVKPQFLADLVLPGNGLTPSRAWFMVFGPGGSTTKHKHADADLITVTGISGVGAIRVWSPTGRESCHHVERGKTLVMWNEEHCAIEAGGERSSLVINWKQERK